MDTKPYIIANWKMNLDGSSTDRFLRTFNFADEAVRKSNVIIAPSLVQVSQVCAAVADTSVAVAGQDIYWEDSGAFTGEVSASQLVDAGASFVIIGHSERRTLFGETDAQVHLKALQAIKRKLRPIVCFGESYAEKEAGETKRIIRQRVTSICEELRAADVRRVILAYEPLWAISTSHDVETPMADSPESAQVIHKLIRKIVEELYGEQVATEIRILYGGSVDPDNVGGYASMDDIDGVLVGGASKDAHTFQKLITNYISASS